MLWVYGRGEDAGLSPVPLRIRKLRLFLRRLCGPGQNMQCVYAPSFPLSDLARTTAQRGLRGTFALNGL